MSTDTTQPTVSDDAWTAEHDRPIEYTLTRAGRVEVEGDPGMAVAL